MTSKNLYLLYKLKAENFYLRWFLGFAFLLIGVILIHHHIKIDRLNRHLVDLSVQQQKTASTVEMLKDER